MRSVVVICFFRDDYNSTKVMRINAPSSPDVRFAKGSILQSELGENPLRKGHNGTRVLLPVYRQGQIIARDIFASFSRTRGTIHSAMAETVIRSRFRAAKTWCRKEIFTGQVHVVGGVRRETSTERRSRVEILRNRRRKAPIIRILDTRHSPRVDHFASFVLAAQSLSNR